MSETDAQDLEFEFETAGERLASARHDKGLSLEAIASKTRVPIRYLQAIETSDYDALPGRTYAIGFAKAYARMVDVSEDDIASALRTEIDEHESATPRSRAPRLEPDEPSNIPSRRIAWMAAAVGAALLIAGFGVWRTYFFPGADDSQYAEITGADETGDGQAAALVPAAASATDNVNDAADNRTVADPKEQVVFTATVDNVWVKFYDGSGDQLMQKQMALGESYIVPQEADNPQIWTGRPDGFKITIGGQPVPPLGDAERAIKDVPVSASALLARSDPPANDEEGEENGDT